MINKICRAGVVGHSILMGLIESEEDRAFKT